MLWVDREPDAVLLLAKLPGTPWPKVSAQLPGKTSFVSPPPPQSMVICSRLELHWMFSVAQLIGEWLTSVILKKYLMGKYEDSLSELLCSIPAVKRGWWWWWGKIILHHVHWIQLCFNVGQAVPKACPLANAQIKNFFNVNLHTSSVNPATQKFEFGSLI